MVHRTSQLFFVPAPLIQPTIDWPSTTEVRHAVSQISAVIFLLSTLNKTFVEFFMYVNNELRVARIYRMVIDWFIVEVNAPTRALRFGTIAKNGTFYSALILVQQDNLSSRANSKNDIYPSHRARASNHRHKLLCLQYLIARVPGWYALTFKRSVYRGKHNVRTEWETNQLCPRDIFPTRDMHQNIPTKIITCNGRYWASSMHNTTDEQPPSSNPGSLNLSLGVVNSPKQDGTTPK